MREPSARLVFAALSCVAVSISGTLADRWGPPSDRTYLSQGQHFRFSVHPRVLSSAADYWHDYDRGPHKRGQLAGKQDVCIGQLEKRAADGSYVSVWKRELVNDVSPVTALVTTDGSNVVTFDNWHSMGYGADVVVIYGPDGQLIASFGLDHFLSMKEIAVLPRSVSSIQWGGDHHFDETEKHLVLEIAAEKRYSVVISLADGRVQSEKRNE
jgi:hypothetical protein